MEKVSIIMPVFNSYGFTKESILSVISQTYSNWELLITDDKSTDGTYEKLKKFVARDKRIKVFRLSKNSGPAAARNNSIEKASGRYIAFLDSDDTWQSDKIERQIRIFENNPTCPLVYTGYNIVDQYGKCLKYQNVPDKASYDDLLKSCSIGCLTVVLNLSVTGKVYMPLIKRRQDFALWLKILRKHGMALGMNVPLANYRIGQTSISSNKLKVIKYQWKTYFEIEELGVWRSSYYMFHWAFNGLKKHYF